jgi:uncharacterized protein YegP (UPF0339 family)
MSAGATTLSARIPPTGRNAMAGMFELFLDSESSFRFRLTAPDGTVMAVSKAFETKNAAVAGIAAVREYAGMGLISDFSTTVRREAWSATHDPFTVQGMKFGRIPATEIHSTAKPRPRAGSSPARRAPWTRIG